MAGHEVSRRDHDLAIALLVRPVAERVGRLTTRYAKLPLAPEQVERCIELVGDLEKLDDVGDVVACLDRPDAEAPRATG